MKTLRASGTRLQADVVVGKNEYGSDVTVAVTIDRKDPDLVEALAPIQKLLRDRALGVLDRALENDVVDQRVREVISKEREQITRTAKANAEHAIARQHQSELQAVRRELATVQSELRSKNHENERLQQSLSTKSEREDG